MKDSYYFKHDSNARHDPKIRALIKKYGMAGYGRFWVVIEMLRESANYKLESEPYVWDALAEQMKCTSKEAKSFIDDCVKNFKLFVNGDGFFYSTSLVLRMNKLDEIREKRKRAAAIRWKDND